MEDGVFTPEQVVQDPVQTLRPMAQAVVGLSARDLFNQEWVKRRDAQREDNLRRLDRQFYHGTYFVNGAGQKRG